MPSSGGDFDALRRGLNSHENDRAGGRYELFDLLGDGGMGAVYRGRDRELDRPVAIKMLHGAASWNEQARKRFHREAHVAASLAHPNLVKVHDAVELDGRPALVMELVEGRPLGKLMAGGASREELLGLLEKALAGIEAVHAKGIVHRDLKPANILVTAGGEPKVADFGLAHIAGSETQLTRTGALVGTPMYMAPEQALGRSKEISPATDVYAMGVILYEMLAGRVPHEADSAPALMKKIAEDPPPPLEASVPEGLKRIVMKALEKDPRRRYRDARDLGEDLRRYREGRPVAAPSTIQFRIGPGAWKAAAAVAALAVVAAMAVVLLRAGEDRRFSQVSLAWGELSLGTLAALRDLEDSFHGKPGVDVRGRLAEIESRLREVEAKCPQTRLPSAWRALARRFAGEPGDFAGGDEPFGDLFLARARLAEYVEKARLPRGSEAVEESPEAVQLRTDALAALDRATANPLWEKFRIGPALSMYAHGARQFASGEFDRAVEMLSGLREDPLLGDECSMLRGVAELRRGRPGPALQAWKGPAARGWTRALAFTAVVAMTEGDLDAAEAAVKRLPDSAAWWDLRVALCLKRRDHRQAVEICTRLIDVEPDNAQAYANRGVARLSLGENQAAVADFDEALKRRPDDAWTLTNRGDAHGRLGGHVVAIADYTEALKLNPASDRALMGRGTARREIGDFEPGERDFDELEKLRPRDASMFYERGRLRYEWGVKTGQRARFESAVADFSRAIELEAKPWRALAGRAAVQAVLGRSKEAAHDCEESLKLNAQQDGTRQLLQTCRERQR